MGNSPAYMTNGDKFGTLALGSYYNLFQALPGRTIKYVNGAFCLDGDDVAASSATCRANGWLLHNSSGQELNSSYGFLLANTGNVRMKSPIAPPRMTRILPACRLAFETCPLTAPGSVRAPPAVPPSVRPGETRPDPAQ